MRKIRNEASHTKEINVTVALRFQELAAQVMSLLSRS